MRQKLNNIKRLVVKLGTALVMQDGKPNKRFIARLARQIADLKSQGREVILVSSGAIGCGVSELGLNHKPTTLPEKQAAAAIGQSRLMHAFDLSFAKAGLTTAQILITREDLRDRLRYLNASNTLNTLLKQGVVPVINENDTVAVEEIQFGDNDALAALISTQLQAELLVILSNIEGLMDLKQKQRISEVARINQAMFDLVDQKTSHMGTGGMLSKLQAAQVVTKAGELMVVASGQTPKVLQKILEGKDVGTLFLAKEAKLTGKKRWIAFAGHAKGQLNIDSGARNALLKNGKSLLPSGISSVKESFQVGDLVHIVCGKELLAKGLVNYSSEDIQKISGLKASQITGVLGKKTYDEVVHRDNLVLLD